MRLWNQIRAQGVPKENFSKLCSMYLEHRRFYHNLNHIKSCLSEFDKSKYLIQQPGLVELAIWYHDIVYNTKTKDNEEMSAQLAYDVCLSSKLSEDFGKKVKDLILVTKHNVIPKEIDAKILIDIDLSILGKSSEEFNKYEQDIRKEYSWISKDKFKQGRKFILKRFLKRDSIYLTAFFREKYETQAGINLQKSIKLLK